MHPAARPAGPPHRGQITDRSLRKLDSVPRKDVTKAVVTDLRLFRRNGETIQREHVAPPKDAGFDQSGPGSTATISFVIDGKELACGRKRGNYMDGESIAGRRRMAMWTQANPADGGGGIVLRDQLGTFPIGSGMFGEELRACLT
ncbi:hypothetical protein Fuma_06140 [Fuerstiella marisgermanici]|uniref:Uncharacterized protein n=1 Tax=Fuerstiella marisgermanici TaxID=1891926 RepID=A0A1P8WQY9_9PLAN|nr:hypothetical protein Fuma_06140 [Fuerstiella marisgermanici]